MSKAFLVALSLQALCNINCAGGSGINDTALEFAKHLQQNIKTRATQALDVVDATHQRLLADVRNGSRAEEIYRSLRRSLLEDAQAKQNATMETHDEPGSMPSRKGPTFEKLLRNEQEEEVNQVKDQALRVKTVCEEMSLANADRMRAVNNSHTLATIEHENFLSLSWCDDIYLKAYCVARASESLVQAIYDEASMNEARLQASRHARAEIKRFHEEEMSIPKTKLQQRQAALEAASAFMELTRRPKQLAVAMANASRVTNDKIDAIDTYVAKLLALNASHLAHVATTEVRKRVSHEKEMIQSSLQETLSELAEISNGEKAGDALTQWRATEEKAYALRAALSTASTPTHQQHELLSYVDSVAMKALQHRVHNLVGEATAAAEAYHKLVADYTDALKAIGDPSGIYLGSSKRAQTQYDAFKARIVREFKASNSALSHVRSAVLTDLGVVEVAEVVQGSALAAAEPSLLSVHVLLAIVASAILANFAMRWSRASRYVREEPLLG